MSPERLSIYREILLRLPAVSLLRFRAVCKRWRAVIDDPCFAKAHTDNQISSNTIIIRKSNGPPLYPLYHFNLEDLDFCNDTAQTISATPLEPSRSVLSRMRYFPLAACNGLILIAPEDRQNYRFYRETGSIWEIWNPVTNEVLKLPEPNIKACVVCMGLGYDCVADDYKVVLIGSNIKSRKTHVYSLKSDSWRMVGDCPFVFCYYDYKGVQRGVSVNGALHWVSDDKLIVAFDVATGNYRQLALPCSLPKILRTMRLEALGGCLFLSYVSNDKNHNHFDAWVMNDYGAEDSWIKLFSLNEECRIRPVAYMKSKRRVLLLHWSGLVWFDFGSNSMKTIDIHGFCRGPNISAQICPGSLLRLHDISGRAGSKTRSTKRGKMKKYDTKLTFQVRDYIKKSASYDARSSCADCYNTDSNWHTFSCNADEILTDSSNPDSDSSVPLDICREIFFHLPTKSLLRFRAVCMAYRVIIDEPYFVRAYTNKRLSSNTILIKNSSVPPFYPLYSFDLDALNFTDGLQLIPTTPIGFTPRGMSSLPTSVCNGLILVADRNWEIWNPLTDECLQLPGRIFNSDIMVATGLGYDYATDDYKAVALDRCPDPERNADVFQTHVYSLRSDSWRMIGNFPCENNWRLPRGPGVSLCGSLHWTPYGTDKIIVLDLRTENYRQMQGPPIRLSDEIHTTSLDLLGGCLAVAHCVKTFISSNDDTDVWVMKDYGAEDSWIKLFSVKDKYNEISVYDLSDNLRPVAYMKNKGQIFLQDRGGLFMFDVESESMKKVSVHGLADSSCAQAFTGSIFRLHDNCGVSVGESVARQRTRMRKRAMEISDTELYFCVRDALSSEAQYNTHNICYRVDEDEDED